MPHSRHSSTRSAVCLPFDSASMARLEWRPSYWLQAALLLLIAAAPVAILASEIPHLFAWPSIAVAIVYGLRLLYRERARPKVSIIVVPSTDGSIVDNRPVTDLRVRWRGPLALLSWREQSGKRGQLMFWPDVLNPAARRELRLAAPVASRAPPSASMAP